MAIITIIRAVKEIHKKDVVLVKIGKFYHVYGKDAYILSYLFGYKLNLIENKYNMCGFPEKSLPKIEATLEQKKINYLMLDRRNNYDVDYFSDNKNLNNYEKVYEKAHKYINIKNRIQKINEYLIENIEQQEILEKIKEIEKIIDERRTI